MNFNPTLPQFISVDLFNKFNRQIQDQIDSLFTRELGLIYQSAITSEFWTSSGIQLVNTTNDENCDLSYPQVILIPKDYAHDGTICPIMSHYLYEGSTENSGVELLEFNQCVKDDAIYTMRELSEIQKSFIDLWLLDIVEKISSQQEEQFDDTPIVQNLPSSDLFPGFVTKVAVELHDDNYFFIVTYADKATQKKKTVPPQLLELDNHVPLDDGYELEFEDYDYISTTEQGKQFVSFYIFLELIDEIAEIE